MELYTFVSSIEFLMLMFIMPALTASSISGERERQTLELMLTTTMKPKEIILGKFWSALTTMLILAISALPVQSLVFVYGGITIADMMILFLCYGIVALFTGGIGMFYSCLLYTSRTAETRSCLWEVRTGCPGISTAVWKFSFRWRMRS